MIDKFDFSAEGSKRNFLMIFESSRLDLAFRFSDDPVSSDARNEGSDNLAVVEFLAYNVNFNICNIPSFLWISSQFVTLPDFSIQLLADG